MHFGGWTRLWIVLTLVYGAIVGVVAYQMRPQSHDLTENWLRDASDVIAEAVSRVEKADLTASQVREGMFADKTPSEAIAWLESVGLSPSDKQRIFSSEIAKLNEKHRRIIQGLPTVRREHVLLAVAWWLGPAIALYVLGWLIGWIVAGFRQPAV